MGKRSLFDQCCWGNGIAACKRMKLDSCLPPYIKLKSKWIKNLNVKLQTITLVKENIGAMIFLALVMIFWI